MKWCNPCALIWVVLLSAIASAVWLNIDWTFCITAAVISIPVIAAVVAKEREDIYFAAQKLVNEIWWLMKNRNPKREPTYAELEREFLGDAIKKTGIYAERNK